RELRLIKDLFHAAGEERRARLVSIIGIAGIGKTRLSAEFERYIDGLVGDIYWHRGRCLAYGEGIAYWALAEMVRMRAGIAEQEPPEVAARKLHETLERHLLDFIDYLLDWSRTHPLFVLALARPELAERRAGWGATKRDFTSIALEPLSNEAIDELLAGLVPDLPEELRARIRERAEGIPLY